MNYFPCTKLLNSDLSEYIYSAFMQEHNSNSLSDMTLRELFEECCKYVYEASHPNYISNNQLDNQDNDQDDNQEGDQNDNKDLNQDDDQNDNQDGDQDDEQNDNQNGDQDDDQDDIERLEAYYSDVLLNMYIHHKWTTTPPCTIKEFVKSGKKISNPKHFSTILTKESFYEKHPYAYILGVNQHNENKKLKMFKPCFQEFQHALIDTRKDALIRLDYDDYDYEWSEDANNHNGDHIMEPIVFSSALPDNKERPRFNYHVVDESNIGSVIFDQLYYENHNFKEISDRLSSYCKNLNNYTNQFNTEKPQLNIDYITLIYLSERMFSLSYNMRIAANKNLVKTYDILSSFVDPLSTACENKCDHNTIISPLMSSFDSCVDTYKKMLEVLSQFASYDFVFSKNLFANESTLQLVSDVFSPSNMSLDDSIDKSKDEFVKACTYNGILISSLFYTILTKIHKNPEDISSIVEDEIINSKYILTKIASIKNDYHPSDFSNTITGFSEANIYIFEKLYENEILFNSDKYIFDQVSPGELMRYGLKHLFEF